MKPHFALILALAGCDPPAADDSGPDDTDADTDTDTDTDADADTDADLWDWCPSPDGAVGDDTWGGRAEVGDGALYCVNPAEHRSLEGNFAAKAQLRVVPGRYAVPVASGSYTVGLPACVAFADGTGLATAGAGGAAAVTTTTWDGADIARATWWEPLSGDATWSLTTALTLSTPEGTPFSPLTVDGDPADPFAGTGYAAFLSPNGDGTLGADSLELTTCGTELWTTGVHTVAFEGGEIELEIQIGESVASTEPSAFVRASGTLDGTPFEQRRYWDLAYAPEHHHFTRHFAVVLPEPVGGVCALRVEGLDPYTTTGAETVSTADCDLAITGSRAVTSSTYTRE